MYITLIDIYMYNKNIVWNLFIYKLVMFWSLNWFFSKTFEYMLLNCYLLCYMYFQYTVESFCNLQWKNKPVVIIIPILINLICLIIKSNQISIFSFFVVH